MELYPAFDWEVFRGATLLFLQGGNPYLFQYGNEFGKVFEPPWTYLFYSPFVFLPGNMGRILLFIVSTTVFFISAIKLGAKRWQLVMYMFSYPVLLTIWEGNADWLVVAGFCMPPALGLFFVLMKPQIGLFVAVFWALQAWEQGGWKRVFDVFMPVTFAYMVSFVAYGPWIFQVAGMDKNPNSAAFFPWTVPVGVMLMMLAGREMKMKYSIMASPFFSPYLSLGNMCGFLTGTFDNNFLFITSWVLLWLPNLINQISHII